eukprot:m.223106 g.223106  ORF g.223106 m.223106 type:complete len:471 (+) comp16179_c0_seq1:54-1466(+)
MHDTKDTSGGKMSLPIEKTPNKTFKVTRVTPSSRRDGKHLVEVDANKAAVVCHAGTRGAVAACIGNVDHHLGKIVNGDVQIAGLDDGGHVADGVLGGDVAMVILQLLMQGRAVAGAQPVHAVVDDRVHAGVPVGNGLHVGIGVEVGHCRRVLHAAESLGLAVTNTENEIASAVGIGHAAHGVGQRVVKLQDVAQNVGEGNAKARLATKGGIGEGHTDLADGNLRRGNASDGADPAGPADVGKGVAVAGAGRGVVHRDLGIVAEGAIDVPVQGAQLHEAAGGCGGRAPGTVHGAGALGELANHVDAADLGLRNAGRDGHAAHLLLKVETRVLASRIVSQIEPLIQTKLGDKIHKPRAKVVEGAVDGRLHFGFKVLPHVINQTLHLHLHQLAMRVAHLVGGAPEVDNGNYVVSRASIIELCVWHCPHKHRVARENRVQVGLSRGRWLAIALGCEPPSHSQGKNEAAKKHGIC